MAAILPRPQYANRGLTIQVMVSWHFVNMICMQVSNLMCKWRTLFCCRRMMPGTPFTNTVSTPAWMNSYMLSKVCGVITDPSRASTVQLKFEFHPSLYWACDYFPMLEFNLVCCRNINFWWCFEDFIFRGGVIFLATRNCRHKYIILL